VILGGVLLALIGSADLLRSTLSNVGTGEAAAGARGWGERPRRIAAATIAVVWSGIGVLAVGGLGLSVWIVAVPVIVALLWLVTTSVATNARTPAGFLPGAGVLAALLAGLVWDRTATSLTGFIVDWHTSAPSSVVADIPLAALVVCVGAALFLMESANIVVRATLRPTTAERPDRSLPAQSSATGRAVTASEPRRRRWWHAPDVPLPVISDLKGGRLIGPLERILIVALTLAGAFPVVAGLLAAKGIVRFPEISADGEGGSKAEYFLVGSLVSWAVALGLTGLIWLAAHS
jgi:hypothetical protein